MRLRLLRAAALALLTAACAPDKKAPVDTVVLVFNYGQRAYEPRKVTLNSVQDITALKGAAANLVGGARFAINSTDPAILAATTEEELAKAVTKDPGHDVQASYIENEGTLIPADFHSLNMVTSYYNVERAYDFFNKVGSLKADQFGTPNIYYFAAFQQEGRDESDNAMFMPLSKGILVLPFAELQTIPLAINLGVVGHEYSHAIMNYRVHGKQAFPQVPMSWVSEPGATPGANLLYSLDEGSADVFGTGITCTPDLVTCDPEFIGSSLASDFTDTRRVDKPHCYNLEIDGFLSVQSFSGFQQSCAPYGCTYKLGSVFSSAVWRASTDAEVIAKLGPGEARKQVFQALWNAQGGGGGSTALVSWRELIANAATNQLEFSLKAKGTRPSVLDAVVEGATDPLVAKALCSAFMDRFGLTVTDFRSSRCATAQSYKECTK